VFIKEGRRLVNYGFPNGGHFFDSAELLLTHWYEKVRGEDLNIVLY